MSDIQSPLAASNSRSRARARTGGPSPPAGKLTARIRLGEGEAAIEKELFGRIAWTIIKLHDAGERGVSSLDEIGPRLGNYVWVLRHREGIAIESIDERHGGDFPGCHSRYRLLSPIRLLEISRPRSEVRP
jgi:hypothetical protein